MKYPVLEGFRAVPRTHPTIKGDYIFRVRQLYCTDHTFKWVIKSSLDVVNDFQGMVDRVGVPLVKYINSNYCAYRPEPRTKTTHSPIPLNPYYSKSLPIP